MRSLTMLTLLLALLAACAPLVGDAAGDEPTQAGAPADAFGTSLRPLPPIPGETPSEAAAPLCVNDVAARFREIPGDASAELAVENRGVLPSPRYTDSVANGFGLNEHFQGIQRRGTGLVVTGGIANGSRMSQLIVMETDGVTGVIDLDPVLWHAGGFQLADNIAAVPLAGDDPPAGEIRFYDLDTIDTDGAPRELAVRIARGHKLFAAGITRELDGGWVVLTWDDDALELFRSRTTSLEDGLADDSAVIDPTDVSGGFQEGGCGLGCGTYQSLNLVADCDGALFVIATRNSNKAAPVVPGDNIASLYALSWPHEDGAEASLALVERRTFACRDRRCNFAAAAGVAVVDDDHLALYSAYHWLQDDRVQLNEFAAP